MLIISLSEEWGKSVSLGLLVEICKREDTYVNSHSPLSFPSLLSNPKSLKFSKFITCYITWKTTNNHHKLERCWATTPIVAVYDATFNHWDVTQPQCNRMAMSNANINPRLEFLFFDEFPIIAWGAMLMAIVTEGDSGCVGGGWSWVMVRWLVVRCGLFNIFFL